MILAFKTSLHLLACYGCWLEHPIAAIKERKVGVSRDGILTLEQRYYFMIVSLKLDEGVANDVD
jgi:hypothetical protein